MQPGRDCERKWKSREDILQVRHHELLPGGQASVFIKKKVGSNTETHNAFASVGAKSSRYEKTKIFTTETFTKKNCRQLLQVKGRKGSNLRRLLRCSQGPESRSLKRARSVMLSLRHTNFWNWKDLRIRWTSILSFRRKDFVSERETTSSRSHSQSMEEPGLAKTR